MSDDAEQWPSFADELGRKSIEQIEKWADAHTAGKITTREFFIAVSTIYDTGSGLAPSWVSDLIANVHEDIRRNARRKKAHV